MHQYTVFQGCFFSSQESQSKKHELPEIKGTSSKDPIVLNTTDFKDVKKNPWKFH